MRILVTGGAGFNGSNVVDRYLADGHEVSVVDNLATGQRENVSPAASFHEVDITDAEALGCVFAAARPEVVNHHAAQMDVRRSVREPVFDAITNIAGSINVIEAGLAVGTRRVIYSSTGGAVYGELEQIPAPESHPINPISQYGISKHTVEHYLRLYAANEGLEYVILRYANVYGPRQNPHGEAGVTAIFALKMLEGERPTIFGPGHKTRDYVFVEDVVAANALALARGTGEAVNIGTGVQTSDQQVYDTIAAAVGFGAPPVYSEERKGDIQHSALAIGHARDALGWTPQVGLAEGVRRTVEALRAGCT